MSAAGADTTARTLGHRLFEVAGILSFWALIMELCNRLARDADGTWEWLAVAVGGLLGYPLADFMSGVVHWVGDALGDESTPVIGRNFIAPFREHHMDPKGITRHSFLETNGNNCIASLPFLGGVWFAFREPGWMGLFATASITSTAVFTFGTNQFHKWAHADAAPAMVRALQRWGLLLSPDNHAIHHEPPHDRYYCITTGWMNAPLTRLRFFEGAEWIIRKLKPDLLHRERHKPAGPRNRQSVSGIGQVSPQRRAPPSM